MVKGMLKGLRGCAAELVLVEQSQWVSYTQEGECHHRAKCIREQTVAAKRGDRKNRVAREERVL